MLRFVLIFLVTFLLMELVSYLAHRFVYHGIGWAIHQSHHSPRKGVFELNDVFPLLFATVTVPFVIYSVGPSGSATLSAISLGITAYGLVYFLVHDLYVHRRMKRLRMRIPLLKTLKQAHAVHHRYGGEPYGLLFFAHPKKLAVEKVDDVEAV